MSANSETNEKLSALLDGELSGVELDQLLDELDSSPELAARWQRMCAVQAARKGVLINPKMDVSAGVMAAIAGVPAPAQDTRVVALPQRPARSLRREWMPAVGLAAAASLAAVVAVTSFRGHEAAAPGVQAVATVAPGVAAGVSGFQPAALVSDQARLDDAAARQLDSLVMEHANYRGGGVGGALGYARVAAHTADYQIVDGQH